MHRKPTFHGDTIYAETQVLDKRESKSKDDRGIVTVETKGFNQRGEEVCYFRRKVMVWKHGRRPGAPAPLRRRRLGLSLTAGRGPAPSRRPVLGSSRGDEQRRDLPWRRTRDPWAVLVSEVMLQQTQVARVVPHYDALPGRVSRRRPPAPPARRRGGARLGRPRATTAGPSTCTAAALASWTDHGGRLPDDARRAAGPARHRPVHGSGRAGLRLRGRRAACRHQRRAGAGPGSRRPPAHGTRGPAMADGLVPPGESWSWNQAVLDLGATVCTEPGTSLRYLPGWGRRACAPGSQPEALAQTTPAARPARHGRQAAFAGSDRQGRGRLVDALRRGPVSHERVAHEAGWPSDPERAARVAAGLVADGLALDAGTYSSCRRLGAGAQRFSVPRCLPGLFRRDGRGVDDRPRRRCDPRMAVDGRSVSAPRQPGAGRRRRRARARPHGHPDQRASDRRRRAAADLRPSVAAQGHPAGQRLQGPARRGRHLRQGAAAARAAGAEAGRDRLVLVHRRVQGGVPRGARGGVHRRHVRGHPAQRRPGRAGGGGRPGRRRGHRAGGARPAQSGTGEHA